MPYVHFSDRNGKEGQGQFSISFKGDDLHIDIGRVHRIVPNWDQGRKYIAQALGLEPDAVPKPPDPVKVPVYISSPYYVKFRNLLDKESIEPFDELKLTEDEFVATIQGVVTVKLPISKLISTERIIK